MCKKADALDAGQFVFDYIKGTYVNVSKKILFSHQFVDAHSAEELEVYVAQAKPTGEWQFYCLKPVAPDVRERTIARYEGPRNAHA